MITVQRPESHMRIDTSNQSTNAHDPWRQAGYNIALDDKIDATVKTERLNEY